MKRPILAVLLLLGVFAGYGSAVMSVVAHSGVAHCDRGALDGHRVWGWRDVHHKQVADEGVSLAP
ncbi:MAG: hypothetical protein ACI9MC_002505 [Kiritimatiellia bacterium]|jgi:hypothetical protein